MNFMPIDFNFIKVFYDWKTLLQIFILWLVIYRIFIFLAGTKAAYLLRGIIILVIFFFLFQKIGLFVLSWLLTKFFAFFLILIVIIFQPELREGLIQLGKRHFFYVEQKKEVVEKTIREIISAVNILAKKKTGALIAIQREIGLKSLTETGVLMNCEISSEILQNIFAPLTPLHDGGVVVQDNKIIASGCLFPLTDKTDLERSYGMRHRAGIGLSEHCDAIVVIVSEENGAISLAINGQLTGDLNSEDLATILKGQLIRNT